MRWLPLWLLVVTACSPKLPDGTHLLPEAETVDLRIGDQLRTERKGSNFFTFVSVLEDSRCPRGVQCIQAGRAVVEVQLLRGGTLQTETIVIDGNAIPTDRGPLQILRLEPYPDAAVDDPAPYRMVVRSAD
ncbi:hypothetical protein CLV84_0244 [Neolewinella xylanilytica]|uniref:Uncharacterized protein n=1 Tax=Neolewinella xylanilytica TaxID=1514080 RepID=A0A2S6I713_9BACT|nr:hypothetical protein [Neolewinella xylanilytica]PPK87306.1 hypothetical protein CLV84_0244 [Neolewinella xylanilytica]